MTLSFTNLLLVYLIAAVVILLLMTRRLPDAAKRNDFLSSLTITYAAVCLITTVLLLLIGAKPGFYFSRYLIIDNLSIYEALIGTVIFFMSACYARGYIRSLLKKGEIHAAQLRLFYIAFNLLEVIVIFAFFSNNLALFWILLELTTVLSAVLIVTLNAKENIVAALKYVFTASTAMLFSVIGLIILFAATKQISSAGTLNWDVLMQDAGSLSPALFTVSFIFIFVGFAAKAGIVPFHTWLPQAHAKAPSVISVLLSAVLLNAGLYGILRLYAVAHLTASAHIISIVLIVFGLLSVAVAALSMLPRGNIKKLIAFSSIENMGFMVLGIGLGTPVVIFWVLFQMLAHSLVDYLLFFSAGILHQQYSSNQFEDMKNAVALQPLASWGLIIGSVAVIGVPFFPVFMAKINILAQLGNFSLSALFITLIFFLLVAAAFAVILIRAFLQQSEHIYEPYQVSVSMKLPMAALFVLIVALGVYFPLQYKNMLNGITASLGF